ncbi:hypothetical protein KBI33_01345 [Candidatus Shapirobacteria bacterium]|nr:hypothetical protein [Candidatus Shapirobacteria bacterium]
MVNSGERVKGPELELSTAGALLATVQKEDFFALIERAQEAGFPNFCVMPFRAFKNRGSLKELAERKIAVIHLEEVWNPLSGRAYNYLLPSLVAGGYGTFLRRVLGRSLSIPMLEDSLFPPQETASVIFKGLMEVFPQAKVISHEAFLGVLPKDRFLLEINPGLPMGKEQIVDWAQNFDVGLVFDPSHLLAENAANSFPGRPTQPKNFWEEQFNYFAKTGKVKVVDIHPKHSYKEIMETPLRELASAAKETASVGYLRVETPLPIGNQLPWLSRGKDFLVLSQLAQILREA